MNFEVLGRVTAWQGAWVADLSPQQQLLLAILVIARGAPIPRAQLENAVWDEEYSPEGGLKRVASELRAKLRSPLPGTNPLPGTADSYQLILDDEQADVLRFRALLARARACDGAQRLQLTYAALGQWGSAPAGLHGGHPLLGLTGRWADGTRAALRAEYRDARLYCLAQDLRDGRDEQLAAECEELATDQDALHDEKFVEMWMLAAYRAGRPRRAEQVYQRARDCAEHQLGAVLGPRLRRLNELISLRDPSLGGPAETLLIPAVTSPATNHRKAMSDSSQPGITVNNSDHAHVENQIAVVNGNVTIGGKPKPDPAEESSADAQAAQASADDRK